MKVSSFIPLMKPCSPTNLNKDEKVKLTKEEQTLEAKEDQTHRWVSKSKHKELSKTILQVVVIAKILLNTLGTTIAIIDPSIGGGNVASYQMNLVNNSIFSM
jgi:hypothetical protein